MERAPGSSQAPSPWPEALERPFAVLAFDWDGTAVADRRADATALRERLLALLARGVTVVIVTGTHLGNVLGQLALGTAPLPARRLFVATNRGSEVYELGPAGGATPVWRRLATPDEDARLDAIAAQVRAQLVARTGLPIAVVSDRMNRRKIDLIPQPEWLDPPKARIGELLAAVQARFAGAGVADGLAAALSSARAAALDAGLPEARVTSDVKHVEVGLTDKGDTMAWVMRHLVPALGVPAEAVLVAGDEFGPVAAEPGSDAQLMIPAALGATYLSVGAEPGGVPAGVIHLPGGPAAFLRLLERQAALPPRPTPPAAYLPTLDPAWTLVMSEGQAAGEHAAETRFALGNGRLGLRAALAEGGATSRPATFAAGVFGVAPDGIPELVVAPDWRHLGVEVDGEQLALAAGEPLAHVRILDLRRGVWHRVWRHRSARGRVTRLHEVRLASLADRDALVQAAWVVPENYGGAIAFTAGLDARVGNLSGARHLAPGPAGTAPAPHLAAGVVGTGATFGLAAASEHDGLAAAAQAHPDRVTERFSGRAAMEEPRALVRKVAFHTTRHDADPLAAALAHAARLAGTDLEFLLAEHAQAWARAWDAADVQVVGDDAAQRALRFALYHLIGAADAADPGASIAARGLTGEGYRGHVFWDTEAYLLPFYTHTDPGAARALLLYRHRTLPAARARAHALGFAGALFAWESTDDGADVTPTRATGPSGEVERILTGSHEHHVSAAIAHAVWQYWQATADDAFLGEAGAEILVEVARFWRSRATQDAAGRCHIRDVIGPDEYHVRVDDDAYTNVMAAWTLARAGEVVAHMAGRHPAAWLALAERLAWDPAEPAAWADVAARLVTGQDPATGVYEQFSGYHQLEDVDLATLWPSPAVALALDPALRARSKAIKQADVVMLLHLLWGWLPADVRAANFAYYEPRTAHGSSLSPATHALVAARLGERELALRYFRLAGAIDLDDRLGNTAAGIHMATQGGLWQAAVFGFGGLQVGDGMLSLAPGLPDGWQALTFPLAYRGWRLRVALTPVRVEVAITGSGDGALALPGAAPRALAAGVFRASREEAGWRWDDPSTP